MEIAQLLDYPKDEMANIQWRMDMLELAERKEMRGGREVYTAEAVELQGHLKELARLDWGFFFNAFLWTYDPRPERGNAHKPFCTYPKQNDYIRWWEMMYRQPFHVSGFVDKPRDMGFSYVTIGLYVWHWWKDDSFNGHLGSRKEDLVEKRGNPDTLMYKAHYMIEHLPEWFLPTGFNINTNHRHMIIDRPDNGNTITGESSNPDFGRGGRYSATMLDEYGFWDWAKSAWESCGQSSHFRLAGTTPPETGKSSHAWKLLSGQAGRVATFTFDFQDVPWKDETWIGRTKDGASIQEFNREVMRSYDSSSQDKVYMKEWLTYPRRDEYMQYNPYLPLYVSWDFGYDGTGLIWWQKDFSKNWNYIVRAYHNKNLDIDFYIPFITGIISPDHHYQPWEIKMIGEMKEWRVSAHFGDPDVKKRSMVKGVNLRDYLATHKIAVNTHTWTAEHTHYNIRENTKLFMKRLTINPVNANPLEEAMNNARYPRRREESDTTSTERKPVHDWTSHLRTALEYYMLNEPHEAPSYENFVHPAGTEYQAQEDQLLQDDGGFSSLAR